MRLVQIACTFVVSALVAIEPRERPFRCGVGPHDYSINSTVFAVYQLLGRCVNISLIDLKKKSGSINWTVLRGTSPLSDQELWSFNENGFWREKDRWRLCLVEKQLGGILFIGQYKIDNNVKTGQEISINIGEPPSVGTATVQTCHSQIVICCNFTGIPTPSSVYRSSNAANFVLLKNRTESTRSCATFDGTPSAYKLKFMFLVYNCFGTATATISIHLNDSDSSSCITRHCSKQEVKKNVSVQTNFSSSSSNHNCDSLSHNQESTEVAKLATSDQRQNVATTTVVVTTDATDGSTAATTYTAANITDTESDDVTTDAVAATTGTVVATTAPAVVTIDRATADADFATIDAINSTGAVAATDTALATTSTAATVNASTRTSVTASTYAAGGTTDTAATTTATTIDNAFDVDFNDAVDAADANGTAVALLISTNSHSSKQYRRMTSTKQKSKVISPSQPSAASRDSEDTSLFAGIPLSVLIPAACGALLFIAFTCLVIFVCCRTKAGKKSEDTLCDHETTVENCIATAITVDPSEDLHYCESTLSTTADQNGTVPRSYDIFEPSNSKCLNDENNQSLEDPGIAYDFVRTREETYQRNSNERKINHMPVLYPAVDLSKRSGWKAQSSFQTAEPCLELKSMKTISFGGVSPSVALNSHDVMIRLVGNHIDDATTVDSEPEYEYDFSQNAADYENLSLERETKTHNSNVVASSCGSNAKTTTIDDDLDRCVETSNYHQTEIEDERFAFGEGEEDDEKEEEEEEEETETESVYELPTWEGSISLLNIGNNKATATGV